jgi:hypothetical protein
MEVLPENKCKCSSIYSLLGFCECHYKLTKIEDYISNYETKNLNSTNKNSKLKIFFDWDDTLFPTSWIKLQCDTSYFNLDYYDRKNIRDLAEIVIRILKLASKLGYVTIVTNAEENWVIESTALYMREAFKIVSDIPIISARQKYEKTLPNDFLNWKALTFIEEIDSSKSVEKVVSIGDSSYEKDGIKKAVSLCNTKVTCKTIKLKEFPSIEVLIKQLIELEENLEKFINDDTIEDFYLKY